MREYGFELRLCARLEADGALIARQLGGGVASPGGRVLDIVDVAPGPSFDRRTAITDRTIPDLVLDADVGAGRETYWKAAVRPLDVHPERAREAIDRAVEIGFLEASRRNGRTYVRQVARYPTDWFGRIRAIENKPDLGEPGALERQLRTDVALGLVDEVVLATASHVTGAHLNRIPDPVGVWRVRDDEIEMIRPATPLSTDGGGIEILAEHPGRTDVSMVGTDALTRARRSLAERAYGKGWRPDELPGCERARVDSIVDVDGIPGCAYHDRVVEPTRECGAACPGYTPADPPAVDLEEARDRTAPWQRDPDGLVKTQASLGRYE